MFRYLGLIWDVADPQHTDAVQLLSRRLLSLSSQWRESLSHGGLRVFSADAKQGALESQVLTGNAGVVLGTLFERRRDPEDPVPSRKAALSRQTAAILDSRGQWLVDNCWGNYVAFLRDPVADRTWIVKDPTGNLPCFGTVFRGVAVFFSCIADCAALRLQFTINRSYLAARLIGGNSSHAYHALNEVQPVHRGECVEIAPRLQATPVSRQLYWNPLRYTASQEAIEDPEQAARALRATVRAVTHSWASCHDSVLHRLSGGLDSSIVLGCLKDAATKPRIACYTYYNPRGRSDERPWAHFAAQHAGCEHLECAIAPEDIQLNAAARMPLCVEPASTLGYLHRATLEKRLAAERRATGVFTGDGGDSGFCSDSIVHAVPEYLRRRGLRPGVLRLASQVALSTEQSTWSVLSRSLRRWLLHPKASGQRERLLMSRRLLSSDIRDQVGTDEGCSHPWFSNAGPGCAATIRRVGALLQTPQFYEAAAQPEEAAPEVLSPLYSQPAVELFLRIPLYVHFHGRDRGLARQAFTAEVPEPILRRLWKDRAPGFHDELLERNRGFLRDLLLEGILVHEGLLDRAAVAQALSGSVIKSAIFPGEILQHLDLEIWARSWTPTPGIARWRENAASRRSDQNLLDSLR